MPMKVVLHLLWHEKRHSGRYRMIFFTYAEKAVSFDHIVYLICIVGLLRILIPGVKTEDARRQGIPVYERVVIPGSTQLCRILGDVKLCLHNMGGLLRIFKSWAGLS
ncbi:hypothetical protein CENSYa_0116 [Cenarchaeum symbiosum A]|uniref:Uncharacterized protein n=1 Tax=Cenarchaeum symbiosum (strain A) TaxID=414004 RepID=A0RTU4_CENSY|nr:hypothetical protein CENSYa_0116 [Cenarchaeum symbiosum A]